MNFLVFVTIFVIVQQWEQFVEANYQITVLEYDVLVKNDDKFLNMDKVKLKRKSRNETHKFYGQFTFFRTISLEDDVKVALELYKKSGGEYRKTAYHVKGMQCQFVANDDVFFPSLARAAGFSEKVNLFLRFS